MQKYKKAAINIAFLTMLLSTGISDNSLLNSNTDWDSDLNDNEISKYSQARQEEIISTFEDDDYQAWKKIVGQNNKLNKLISEFEFQLLVKARTEARNWQYDEAIKITDWLKETIAKRIV